MSIVRDLSSMLYESAIQGVIDNIVESAQRPSLGAEFKAGMLEIATELRAALAREALKPKPTVSAVASGRKGYRK